MEKLITKRNLSLFGIVSFVLVIALYFILQNNSKDDEKLYYLSSLDNPKVSFFSDLKLTSIENLDRYNKIDKDIILLKKALIDLDKELIKSLSLDNNFTFNEIAKIYFYNLDINNFEFSESDRDNLNNFFIKAVDRLSNEKN